MKSLLKSKTHVPFLVLLMVVVAGNVPGSMAASHKIKPGDPTPEFSVLDLSGDTYTYKHENDNALMVLFLSARQKTSFKAQTDLVKILGQLSESAKALDVVIALDDPNAFSALTELKRRASSRLIVTLDQTHHLWGRFGVIAMPTVVISNAQGQVVRYEAGYGYNFAPVVRSHLDKVLGVESEVQASVNQVTTVSNGTPKAKLARLINAANMMAARGHFEAAILEIQKAQDLDPNSVEVRLSLAELYCRASKGKEALETLQDVTGRSRSQKAQILSVSGWAYRLTGHLDDALKALMSATEQAPEEAQAFYELGRVYELKGLKDEALDAYRRALGILL